LGTGEFSCGFGAKSDILFFQQGGHMGRSEEISCVHLIGYDKESGKEVVRTFCGSYDEKNNPVNWKEVKKLNGEKK
jgi:hypothetical protein